MLKTICFVFCLLTAAPAWCAGTDWTTTDTVLQVLFTTLLEVDRRQTHWIADNPSVQKIEPLRPGYSRVTDSTHYEKNSIIGIDASNDRINTYFATVAVGHAAIAYSLRKSGWELFNVPAVTIWQSVWIGVEGRCVARNISAGVKIQF